MSAHTEHPALRGRKRSHVTCPRAAHFSTLDQNSGDQPRRENTRRNCVVKTRCASDQQQNTHTETTATARRSFSNVSHNDSELIAIEKESVFCQEPAMHIAALQV